MTCIFLKSFFGDTSNVDMVHRHARRHHRRAHVHRAPRIQRVHNFCRTADLSTGISYNCSGVNGESVTVSVPDATLFATGNAGTNNFTYFNYATLIRLADLPDSADFVDLFDQYKITRITLSFKPFAEAGSLFTTASNNSCSVMHYSVLDHDDATLPTPSNSGVQKLREYQTFRESKFLRSWRRTTVPHLALAAFSGAFTSYTNTSPIWLDIAYPSVQHYGFKGLIEVFAPNSAVPTDIWFRPEMKVYFSCREVR